MAADHAPRRVHLDFTGCRLNQAEIEQMGRAFAGQGDLIADRPDGADLVVINTCAVTLEAGRKSRQMILQAGRANPDARIVATGCYAALQPGQLARLPNVTHVINNADKDRLVDLVGQAGPDYEREPIQRGTLAPGALGHTRAFIKVQDGCDNRCAFCVTTIARGAGRSKPLDEIVAEIDLLHGLGYQEAVLTGVHLGSYGHDLGDPDGLTRLVSAILERTAIPRLRLSSLEPWDLTPDFFDLWADPRLCPHLHLPLQAGCDDTLRRMARRTTTDSFAELVAAAQSRILGLALTTDLIAGFPGETDAEFEQTLWYVEQTGFARLHVFSYSPRPGTAAARMPDQVPHAARKERRQRLVEISDRLWTDFRRARIGRKTDVLWESARGATPEGLIWAGYTPDYMRAVTVSPEMLGNSITPAQLVHLEGDDVRAVVGAV